MSAPRLVSVLALLLASCAAWDSTTPSNAAPLAESPTPSHYAPPPPGDPRSPEATPIPDVKVAIASVQLLQDCPDPAPAGAPSPSASGRTPEPIAPVTVDSSTEEPLRASQAKRRPGQSYDRDESARRMCTQSTVQLSIRSDRAGAFKVEGVRVLDAASKKLAGPAQLRGPTLWNETNGTYTPWDQRTLAGTEMKISYKLNDPDMSQAAALVGPDFNSYMGPFLLEVDVSVDGKQQTIRSAEFSREPPHLVVT